MNRFDRGQRKEGNIT